MTFNENQDYWASVYFNDVFLSVETYSGLGRIGIDPMFPPHYLQPDESDQCIGKAVLQALSNSRSLTLLEERVVFFDSKNSKEKYDSWVANLLGKYNYKNKKTLFKDMKKCGIHLANNKITFYPTVHEKLEAWSGEKIHDSDYVIISADVPLAEIGASLKLAMSRCKG